MASETYYFIFSILVAFLPGIHASNMVYYRLKNKNLIGRKFKPNTIEYESMQKHSSNRSLAILGVVTLLGITNLFFAIYRLLHLENQEYARFALLFTPSFIIVISLAVIIKIRNQFGDGKDKKTPRKFKKDNDSWL